MEEREIEKILKPQKKLIIIFIIFLIIAIASIGVVFYARLIERKEPVELADIISKETQKEGQYVKLDLVYLPRLMTAIANRDTQFYYVTDINNQMYLVSLQDTTFEQLKEQSNKETGELNNTYSLKGMTKQIDAQIKDWAIYNSNLIDKEEEINSDNFSEYFGNIYVEEKSSPESDRLVTLYTISVLVGVFFLILAFGYILPNILKVRKVLKNPELQEELRIELGSLTDTPYKEQHIYLTKNYIISGLQAIKYEEITWGYVEKEMKYGITAGRNLIVHTKDNKRHIIGSVVADDNILDNILEDIYARNTDMKVGEDKK